MAVVYCLGFLFLLGYVHVQGNPLSEGSPAFIEDLRSSRIVAGWEAQDGQIPHQISLRMVSGSGLVTSCGGSIIHHGWVITAAHCLANRFTFVVRFGLTNLTQPEHIVETTKKVIHPRYIEAMGGVQTDDIALLGLDRHIPYGRYVQPCRLQNSETKNVDYTGIRFTVSGYGLTDDTINGGTTSEVLRWVHLRGISNAECRSWYPNTNVIREQTICAEYYNDTAQSSCQGDSGGPLTIVDVDGKPTMVGIVSFGSSAGCNSPFPSAYVRPGHYHDWYVEVTGLNFDWKSEELEGSSSSESDSQESGSQSSESQESGSQSSESQESGSQSSESQESVSQSSESQESVSQSSESQESVSQSSESQEDSKEDNGEEQQKEVPIVVVPLMSTM